MYIPTKHDLEILKQKIHNVSLRIEIYSKENFLNDTLTLPEGVLIGKVISDNYSFDVDSDIRKTFNLTLSVSPEYDMVSINKLFWLHKIIKIICSTIDFTTGQEVEYSLGFYVCSNFVYTVNATDYSVQISCMDLIALLNGEMDGQLRAQENTVKAYDCVLDYGDVDIRDTELGDPNDEEFIYDLWITKELYELIVEEHQDRQYNFWQEYEYFESIYDTQNYDIYDGDISEFDNTQGHWIYEKYCYWRHKIQEILYETLDQLGYAESKYINTIDIDPMIVVEYDIELGTGATYWDVFTNLRTIAITYEMYFDMNGHFVFHKLPIRKDDPNVLNKNDFNDLVINESLISNISQARNVTRLYGNILEGDVYITANAGIPTDSHKYVFLEDLPKGKYAPFVIQSPITGNMGDLSIYSFDKINYFFPYQNDASSSLWQLEQGRKYWVQGVNTRMTGPDFNAYWIIGGMHDINVINYEWSETGGRHSRPILTMYLDYNGTNQAGIIQWPTNGSWYKLDIYWNSNQSHVSMTEYIYVYGERDYVIYDLDDEDTSPDATVSYCRQGEYVYLGWGSGTCRIEKTKFLIPISNAEIFPYTTNDNYITNQGTYIGITFDYPPTSDSYIKLNDKLYNFYSSSNSLIGYEKLVSNIPYIFELRGNKLQLLGEHQIQAIAKTVEKMPSNIEREQDYEQEACRNIIYRVEPDSPFAIEKVGVLNQILSGGDYDNINTTYDAMVRVEYENWKSARIDEVLTLNCLMIPWLEGNEKVEYQLQKTGVIDNYIIKQISGSVSNWTQTLTMQKFYPYIPT